MGWVLFAGSFCRGDAFWSLSSRTVRVDNGGSQADAGCVQRAHEKLAGRCGPEVTFRPMEIYLASPEADEGPLLDALLDRSS